MRAYLAVLSAIVGLGGCVSEPEPRPEQVSYYSGSRFVQTTPERPAEQFSKPLPRAEFEPDPNEPITIDFVMKELPRLGFNPVPGLERMPFGDSMFGPWDVGGVGPDDPPSANGERFFPGNDLHTAMHCIALRTGLQIIVEHDRNLKLPVGFEVPTTKSEAIELIQSICKACKLDYVQDGDVIIVKRRPWEQPLARWTLGDVEGTFNIFMEDVELVAAVMEVAVAFKVQIFFPASLSDEPDQNKVERTQKLRITLDLRNATADKALRKLAQLGDLELKVEQDENGVSVYIFSLKG